MDEKAIAIVDATSTKPYAIERINSLSELVSGGFERFQENPGPTRYIVHEVITGTTECLVVSVEVDSSDFVKEPSTDRPPGETMIELLPAAPDQRDSGLNPTAWVVDSIPLVTAQDALPDCAVTE